MPQYQMGNQRIEVIVRKEGGGENLTGANTTDSGASSNGGATRDGWIATLTGSNKVSRQYRVIMTNATHTLATMRQFELQWRNWWIQGMGMRHGDQAFQEQWERTAEIFTDTTGFAASVAMGAIYGSWGGPLGTFMGAMLGAVNTSTSLAAKYSGRRREFNYKLFKENNAIEYRRARASINLTTGRLR